VKGWLAAPHNKSLTLPFPTGNLFLQQRASKCASGGNLASGNQIQLGSCEGYDPALHPQIWQLVPVSGTSFYQIKTTRSGVNRCMDVTAQSGIPPIASVILQACNSADLGQRWLFAATHAGTAQAGLYYKLTNQQATSGAMRPNGSSVVVKTDAFAPDSQDWMVYR
jgi:hypothetical protein